MPLQCALRVTTDFSSHSHMLQLKNACSVVVLFFVPYLGIDSPKTKLLLKVCSFKRKGHSTANYHNNKLTNLAVLLLVCRTNLPAPHSNRGRRISIESPQSLGSPRIARNPRQKLPFYSVTESLLRKASNSKMKIL